MHIDSYIFGRMSIDGIVYRSDLILFPDRVKAQWWRKEDHVLSTPDLEEVFAEQPKLLIIGTGAFGLLEIAGSIESELLQRNIRLIARTTAEAVQIFNTYASPQNEKVVAAFHLTC